MLQHTDLQHWTFCRLRARGADLDYQLDPIALNMMVLLKHRLGSRNLDKSVLESDNSVEGMLYQTPSTSLRLLYQDAESSGTFDFHPVMCGRNVSFVYQK